MGKTQYKIVVRKYNFFRSIKHFTKIIKFLLFSLLLSSFFSLVTYANELHLTEEEKVWLDTHKTIKIGAISGWPPYNFYNDRGDFSGIAAEILKYIEKNTGLKFNYIRGEWDELKLKLKNNDIDILSAVYYTKERAKYMLFTRPFSELQDFIFTRKDRNDIHDINSISRIAIVKGYSQGEIIKNKYPQMTIIWYDSMFLALKGVIAGHADAYIGSVDSVSYLIADKHLTKLKVAAPTKWNPVDVSMGINTHSPELLGIMNKAIALIPEYEKNKINRKWFALEHKTFVDYSYLWYGLVLTLIITAYFLFRHRKLHAKLQLAEKGELIGKIAQSLDSSVGDNFFVSLSKQLSETLNAEFAFIGRLLPDDEVIDIISIYGLGNTMPTYQYSLQNTPCKHVLQNSIYILTNNVQKVFPNDKRMADMGIRSYSGIRLNNALGKPIGILVIMSQNNIHSPQLIKDLLRIFSVRASYELERKEITKTLSHQVYHDSLTGISNRRFYNERIVSDVQYAKKTGDTLSLLAIDIDYFKQYNDEYGHDMGDVALHSVAQKIKEILPRDTDSVSRFGGEEFVVLLPSTDSQDVFMIAERIRNAIMDLAIPHNGSETSTVLTVSIGISSLEGNSLNERDLFKFADDALYSAKNNGRNISLQKYNEKGKEYN